MIPSRASDAGPDHRTHECRGCHSIKWDSAGDCEFCQQPCCTECAEPMDFYSLACHRCLGRMADAIKADIEADSKIFDPPAAEAVSTLAQAGCTIEETAAYLDRYEKGQVD